MMKTKRLRRPSPTVTRIGGPDVPPIPHGGYWDNDIQLDRGEENLMVVILRESGRSRRLVAKCCHSTLLIDHPNYKGIQFLLFENACKIPWDNNLDPPTAVSYTHLTLPTKA